MRRRRGALEEEVLAAVHAAERPVSVAEVAALLDGGPAHTTVMTTLARLWTKGALTRETQGRGHVYAPAASREGTTAAQTARSMRRLLDAEGRRGDVLARFVAELDPADEDYLRSVLGGSGPASPPEASR
ncbi:BlaI/MecI/CopY family transcriptional regulator [Kineococcus rubinsiae]|uniref:BlaI/MecI/CopY family transcriptional regulator n=1 Tax=Kineococcus rubinsiae TaxID=2609562 RepID=UPI0014300150|nr:BlaI/MecI/CopY family transcriptional regulator [Kineococcus rubinsiae]NIZ89668.1 BlaI/MecI/CopY family transcriptional regulator [Kineococcus rubinsiae]